MSDDELPPPASPRRPDAAHRLTLLVAALAVCALALWVPMLNSDGLGSMSAGRAAIDGVLLALGFLALEGAQAHIEVRRQTFSITLSEAPLVVGLALTSPLILLLARGLAMALSE